MAFGILPGALLEARILCTSDSTPVPAPEIAGNPGLITLLTTVLAYTRVAAGRVVGKAAAIFDLGLADLSALVAHACVHHRVIGKASWVFGDALLPTVPHTIGLSATYAKADAILIRVARFYAVAALGKHA